MPELLKDRSIHRHIYLDLERKIVTGELSYMSQLPTLPNLCDIYGVSEAPVRRALDDLSRDGLIEKRRGRGKGTRVIKRLVPTTVRVLSMLGDCDYKIRNECWHDLVDIINGIREATRDRGCRLQMVSRVGFDSIPPADRSTGYLIVGDSSGDYLAGTQLAAPHGVPIIGVNPPDAGCVPSAVRVDMKQGVFAAVSYLIELGHRNIGYVGGTRYEWMAPRFEGYREALEKNGVPFRPELVYETSGLVAAEEAQALDTLMSCQTPPTALFTASDYRALHLMDACRQRGIAVPQQLSICGYDNMEEAASVEPGLTTVNHPRQELSRIAVDKLYLAIHEGVPLSDYVVEPHLVVRESCTRPAGG